MAGNYKFSLDQKDIVRFLTTTVGSFIQDRLLDKEQRIRQKEQCAERLAAEDGDLDKDSEIHYSDQAVLANLDWGIDALEEAINTSNMETKLARLNYAEKMLQVCAMLDSSQKTAGVPNFYLSAWAHLNLSYLWTLQNNGHNAVLHILEMFEIDPFFSRIDFAPELWKTLFLPHMSSVVGWYSEERHRLVMDVIPDASDLSITVDFDQYFNESLIFSTRPDQVEKMQNLEQVYGQSLDQNTRLYANYYKDCINFDSTTSKKVSPMLPIVEPPMTPLHEMSRSIPDYIKFGPILPKSAGFSPILKSRENAKAASRLSVTSTSSQNQESAEWDPQQEGFPEGNDDDSVKVDDVYENCKNNSRKLLSLRSFKNNMGEETKLHVPPKNLNGKACPTTFSPVDSPKTESPRISSSKTEMDCKKGSAPLFRLDSINSSSMLMSPHLHNDFSIGSIDSDGEVMEMGKSSRKNDSRMSKMYNTDVTGQVTENSYLNESDEGSQSCISIPLSEKSASQSKPPKDFVCPITGQIFCDPVTLETGQTYERKAIQEWMKRGNTTCPITRQPLSATTLPKTNYVLKRLISSWKEQHPDLAQEFCCAETPMSAFESPSSICSGCTPSWTFSPQNQRNRGESINNRTRRFLRVQISTSPTSVISQADLETVINGLKPHISCLCTSDDLQECELAVLTIARMWKDSKADPGLHSYLSKPTIVSGFVEMLSASLNKEVLRTSLYILSELIFADEQIGETLISVESDFDCLAALLRNGLAEAAVVIYLLRPAFSQLSSHDLIPSLTQIILTKKNELDHINFVIEPKDAAIALLEQLLVGGDENSRALNAMSIISANGIPALIDCLDKVEGRLSVVSILLCCIHADRGCKNLIASRVELSPVLDLFHAGNDSAKGICIDFLCELVQLNRRTFCNQVLQIIKEEGDFSTMHSLLVYLQMAPMEQQPAIATLLLQLDLLVEPRKMSIYREEAIDTLIEALRKKDFPSSQIMALDALLSLSGHVTALGKPCTEAWLLKIAGFDQQYNTLMRVEQAKTYENELGETMEEEEKAASSWEKRVAFVLCNHEKGAIFKALEECLNNSSIEMAKLCLVMATWLIYMLYCLPDIGIRDIARRPLLDQFINVLQSSKNLEEKILATLALKSFISDPGALNEVAAYAKCMYKTLRKLKRNSPMINDMLKTLMNLPSINPGELWCCNEIPDLDSCTNGEILSLLHLKGRIISSHSDGTIKVWDASKRAPRLIQEVREHTKAVTCLYVSSLCDKLYSGSLDKTIRVWAIKQDEIHCLQVHDVKDTVLELTADANVACFSSQGTGVKIYNWSGVPKHINFNKNVRSLAMTGSKLYCGCTGYSIQEVDLCKYTSTVFYSGARKLLLGKQTIHSLRIHNGVLYAGGSSVDGSAGKVFSLATKAVIGSLSTGYDIHCMEVNNDFIFTATKCGIIEVWLKERVIKVASIKACSGGHAKVTSLTSDANGDMLFAGSSEGKIQAWALD
ncbi:Ubiquitin--protein ligase [Bertholletia excelsa]